MFAVAAFPNADWPCQVILLIASSFAVESLAVANFATVNFLAAAGFVRCSGLAFGLLSLGRSVASSFEAAAPTSDFFWIAIFYTHAGQQLAQVKRYATMRVVPQKGNQESLQTYLFPMKPMGLGFAATTLLAAGLLVSTFALLLLVAGAVFLPTSDFFSIAIVVSPGFDLTALRTTLVQAGGQTL